MLKAMTAMTQPRMPQMVMSPQFQTPVGRSFFTPSL